MRMVRLLPVIALALLLAVVAWAPARVAADQTGTINGSLVNRTPGGAGVGNASITLVTYKGDTEQGRASTSSDGQGRFQFTGLDTSSDYDYGLSVRYQDAEYMADFRRFDQGASAINWEISVYDATSEVGKIRISRGHLIVDVTPDSLWVLQFFSFVNSGDKTYVGFHPITDDGRKETLRLSLPAAATQITAQEGLDECCAFRTDDGLSDTLAVPPGDKNIVFSYQLPLSSPNVYLDLPLYYPVDSFDLLVSDQAAKVLSQQLQMQDPVDMGGKKYQHLVSSGLPANTELSVDLTNLGGKGGVTGFLTPSNLRWGGIGAAVLAIALVLFYALSLRAPAVATAGAPAPERPGQRDVLLRDLAELDDKFGSGQIGEEKYERLREEKKQRLKDLMSGSGEESEEG